MPEFKQFEIGISTSLYLPAMGTAGLERLAVNGYKRVPAPPPKITANTFFDITSDLLNSHYSEA
jgi:hypothetical protein